MVQTYKYNEPALLEEIRKYIDSTYSEHYAHGKIQAVEYIVDQQESLDYPTGNIIKYASRFGKKEGANRKDLLKAIHYGILSLYFHDKMMEEDFHDLAVDELPLEKYIIR